MKEAHAKHFILIVFSLKIGSIAMVLCINEEKKQNMIKDHKKNATRIGPLPFLPESPSTLPVLPYQEGQYWKYNF